MITKRFGAFILLSTCGFVVCLSVAARLHADAPPPQAPMPPSSLSAKDTALLEKIQRRTFGYFWDFAQPDSGLARERSKSRHLVTSGGSGMGILAILVAAERNWVTRQDALDRMHKIVAFLDRADRFHGAWPHWMDGRTGKVIRFSPKDDGADLVETSVLMQGLLAAREYFSGDADAEKDLRRAITALWRAVEWNWFTRGGDALLWHWSPKYGFEMNLCIGGWNECLITYVLAASSPTHPIEPRVYHAGWARNGKMVNGKRYLGLHVPLGRPEGGPLFFAHCSFLGLDPRNLKDRYADYWQQNVNHTLVNYLYCVTKAKPEYRYSERCWGLTASDDPRGYLAHQPGRRDNGTIAPTAALASMPYAPEKCLAAARYFDGDLGDRLWGPCGFLDAFNLKEGWFAKQHVAADQGPVIVMIENYRTGLVWETFMKCDDVRAGLKRLGFTFTSSSPRLRPRRPVAVPGTARRPFDGRRVARRRGCFSAHQADPSPVFVPGVMGEPMASSRPNPTHPPRQGRSEAGRCAGSRPRPPRRAEGCYADSGTRAGNPRRCRDDHRPGRGAGRPRQSAAGDPAGHPVLRLGEPRTGQDAGLARPRPGYPAEAEFAAE
ncbi:MAG: glucoamylase family protein [Planctomycetota bacterium]|nr:glucoamylase family protein [Planctomycetota bacterium]